MKSVSEKKRLIKPFCAVSVAAIMVCSSLVSVAAAIAGAGAEERVSSGPAVVSVAPSPKKVVLDVNGTQRTVLFSGKTVEELLSLTNTSVSNNQIVVPERSKSVTSYMVVTVRDAKPVKVTADGKIRTVMLAYGKVTDALRLAGISLGSEDILSVKRDAEVASIDELTIQRVTYEQVTETLPVACQKVKKNSDKVALGETKLSVKGKKGEKQVVKKIRYIDGRAVRETVLSEKVTKAPVDEVTLVGAKGAGTTEGAGTFTDQNGVKVAYKEVLTGSGTAYTADSGACTATGVPAYRGGVAVNPDLIPYGSKLYVVSDDGSVVYGYCTAVDTGGALMDGSAIVDCFYDTYDECMNFGRRDVKVYVLA